MSSKKPEIVLIAHDLRSCYNVGSLLRLCDGLGVETFIATGHTPYPVIPHDNRLPHVAQRAQAQIAKTALGAEASVDIQHSDIETAISNYKDSGFTICALEQADGSIALRDHTPSFPSVLIVGNEPTGLPETILELCDEVIEIPMKGKKESFNVATAASIALWEFIR